ncbi:MAG: hypothetical protein O3C40_12690 [Planctomycetota bacterium]|nr:hypothetical protein [Planctomycetota bacterium]
MNGNCRQLFPDQNPFSTAAVKPGAIEFRFCGDSNASSLVTTLQRNRWHGEIVGPHGSGKSTLLQTLLPVIEAAGRVVRYYVAKPNESQLPIPANEQATWTASTQVVVEGYELLTRRQQKMFDRACREKQAGLLVTCHKPQGLPPLFHTSITIELAISLVELLLPAACDFITPIDVRDSFSRHGQNLRELLFEMYDLYEQRRPQ